MSGIKSSLVVKFVFLKKELGGDKALVLMTDALEVPADEVIASYNRRWDIEAYYRDCLKPSEWASTRSGRST